MRALAALLVLAPAVARADLRDDAQRVATAWGQGGSQVLRPAPFFLEQGRQRQVTLDARSEDCLSVAVLAPRSIEFALRPLGVAEGGAARAVAGLVFLSRCGEGREHLARFAIEMRGARGAFEVVAAAGPTPAPDPRDALPERINPPTRPLVDPGRAPGTETLAARAARAEARASADGAAEVLSATLSADDEGQGRKLQAFREGCHRVEILADHGLGGRVGDVDAELRDPRSQATIVRDRSDTPDARVEFCLGEPGAAAVFFRGAPANARATVVSSRWALPPALPTLWGPRARGAMAQTLARRRAPAPLRQPLRAVTGVGGTTLLPLELTPGACYLLLLGLARGEAKGLSISGALEGHLLHDEGGQGRDGLALTFCSQHTRRLPLSIEARGGNLVWGAALWRVEGSP